MSIYSISIVNVFSFLSTTVYYDRKKLMREKANGTEKDKFNEGRQNVCRGCMSAFGSISETQK